MITIDLFCLSVLFPLCGSYVTPENCFFQLDPYLGAFLRIITKRQGQFSLRTLFVCFIYLFFLLACFSFWFGQRSTIAMRTIFFPTKEPCQLVAEYCRKSGVFEIRAGYHTSFCFSWFIWSTKVGLACVAGVWKGWEREISLARGLAP